ncbi:MAG: DUF3892 domain-containing protein [Polyangiaceae bacterium]
MVRLRIECTRSRRAGEIHERITHVGGRDAQGVPWTQTQADAIRAIHEGERAFYLLEGDEELEVVIRQGEMGHEFLTVVKDGETQKRLRALPPCKTPAT